MRKFSVPGVLVVCILFLGGLASGQQAPRVDTAGESVLGVAVTASQKAIFAPFLSRAGDIDTAISISNVLAAPPGIQEPLDGFSDREGTLEFFLWNSDGSMLYYATGPGSPGVGLQPDGTLAPGQSHLVLLSDILNDIGFEESFAGYGWVVANFDGVQGTANVTDFSTFTQTTVMQPDLGSTFFDFDANAGVPIVPPSAAARQP